MRAELSPLFANSCQTDPSVKNASVSPELWIKSGFLLNQYISWHAQFFWRVCLAMAIWSGSLTAVLSAEYLWRKKELRDVIITTWDRGGAKTSVCFFFLCVSACVRADASWLGLAWVYSHIMCILIMFRRVCVRARFRVTFIKRCFSSSEQYAI